jgi:hypothetical protein
MINGKMYELNDDDPNLSALSHIYEEDGKRVIVEIYGNGEGKWILEIQDDKGRRKSI